jgi:hypothetical protein
MRATWILGLAVATVAVAETGKMQVPVKATASASPGEAKIIAGASPGAPLGPWPGLTKAQRLEDWRDLPAEEAYAVFKEMGLQPPAELAQQLNQSTVATPWVEGDRIAGNSPGSAHLIGNTGWGDVFTDMGDTRPLSNYLDLVPYTTGEGECLRTGEFGANDAWYVFTIDQPTRVVFSTCAAAFHYDTRLGLFSRNLEQVAGNDDNCQINGLQSTIDCCLDPGTYYAVVDGYSTNAGEYEISLSFEGCVQPEHPVQGGADDYDYTWISSDDLDGPQFSWVDISSSGTEVVLGDDAFTETPIDLGMDFWFDGAWRQQVYIGSNGMLGFSPEGMNSLGNTGLPDANEPNSLFAVFWDDLNPSAGGTIKYQAEPWNGRFIVQWTEVPAYGGTVPLTFQAILFHGTDMLFQYADLDELDVASATVGIENGDGSLGLQVTYDGAGLALHDQLAVRLNHWQMSHGGPDAGGYIWSHSRDPWGPAYEWNDISGATDLGIAGDDQTVYVDLPWAFPFYGGEYAQMIVCSNGWLGFNITDPAAFSNVSVPTPGSPDNAVFAFWDDLYPADGGSVHYLDDPDGQRVIVQWTEIPHITSPTERYTFQAILHRSGDIVLQYGDMAASHLGSATVGIENADGSIGSQIFHDGNDTGVGRHEAVRFLAPRPRPTRGGQDSGTYAWMNHLDPAGPSPVFIDISGTGQDLQITGDDALAETTLPFAFPFYDGAYTQTVVCSNGWLSFADPNQAPFENQPVPTPGLPDLAIFPFWDDLYPPNGGAVYFQGDANRAIFQWHQIPHISGGGPYTFQAQLYPDGEILLVYQDMGDGATGSATVGIENADGGSGLQVAFNGAGSWLGGGGAVAIYNETVDAGDATVRPAALTLAEPFPNPFNPSTTIEFALGQAGPATLSVFDLAGRRVATLVDGPLAAGAHRVTFDASDLASGLYFATMEAAGQRQTRRLLLIK